MFSDARSDLHRKRSHYVLRGGFVEKYIMTTLQLGTLAVFAYRFGAGVLALPAALRWPLWPLRLLLEALGRSLTGVGINPRTPIGPGFIIHNFSAVNIDAERVGDNFTVNQGVSIGYDWRRSGRPTIGSNVFFGAGAKALGKLTIGDNVVIAANALVINSVPDNCTVAGVPARVIARDGGSRYLQLKSAPPRDGAPAEARA
jgi:serine O-acetyltransferase